MITHDKSAIANIFKFTIINMYLKANRPFLYETLIRWLFCVTEILIM